MIRYHEELAEMGRDILPTIRGTEQKHQGSGRQQTQEVETQGVGGERHSQVLK